MRADGENNSLASLLHQRLVTIGMFPTIQMLELVAGLDLDSTPWLQHPEVKQCMVSATSIVALTNELMSLGKDARNFWPNLVNITSERISPEKWRGTLEQAFLQYDRAAAKLPLELQPWLHLLRSCTLGFAHWHTICPRYLQHQPPEYVLTFRPAPRTPETPSRNGGNKDGFMGGVI